MPPLFASGEESASSFSQPGWAITLCSTKSLNAMTDLAWRAPVRQWENPLADGQRPSASAAVIAEKAAS
ncbi:hypothetical protein LNP25_03955 [Klebsiella variicola subsp. variicola]|nr:hypothetical protein [Klebsiella variicola subsp. variicola]